jgi:hypothetical protein
VARCVIQSNDLVAYVSEAGRVSAQIWGLRTWLKTTVSPNLLMMRVGISSESG